MKVIIDTSSLLSLVRYYLPFDKKKELSDFFRSEFEKGNLILIDAVYEECKYTSNGLVLKTLEYLNQKDFKEKSNIIPVKTKDLSPSKKFYNLLSYDSRTKLSRKLKEAEFEVVRKDFLESADARMVILALNEKNKNNEIAIVTEETKTANDRKAFKKIPAICNILEIKVMTLPDLLEDKNEIDIEFKIKK